MNIFEHNFLTLHNAPLSLSRYQGQPVLLINTATQSGYASQFTGMQKLWNDYRNSGLVVLAVPCNDFAEREPEDEETIQAFLDEHYRVSFPITRKESVTGRSAHSLYRQIADELGRDYVPTWNFTKILFDPRGDYVNSWPTRVIPTDQAITHAIESNLQSWIL